MHKILIIEYDKKMATLLKSHIEKYDFHCFIIENFTAIKQSVLEVQPSLILLDINLPRYDGFYWCRQIRTVTTCPIIFISARTGEMDQVMALENGGDDYITNPFHIEIVIAKIKSLLRRTYGSYAVDSNAKITELNGLYLHHHRLELEYAEQILELSKREFALLDCLLTKHGQVVAREQLLEALWDDTKFVDDNTLSVNVTRVRKKLELLNIKNALETIRGVGYRFNKTWSENI